MDYLNFRTQSGCATRRFECRFTETDRFIGSYNCKNKGEARDKLPPEVRVTTPADRIYIRLVPELETL